MDEKIEDVTIKNNGDVRENFCGACLAVPMAFVGVGATAYGADGSKGKHKDLKKTMLIVGILSILISAAVAIYFLKFCKKCRI